MKTNMKTMTVTAILLLAAAGALAQLNALMMSRNNSIPVVTPATVTELADTFTIGADADLSTHATTTGGFAWVNTGAANSILDISATGKATSQGVSAAELYYVNHTISSANYTVQCDVSYPNTTDAVEMDVGGRSDSQPSGNNSCYFIAWFPDVQQARLYVVNAGTASLLGSSLTTSGTTQTLKLVMSGSTISGYCNGTLIASQSNGSISSAGFVAIGSGIRGTRTGANGSVKATYDNLLVTVP